MLALWFVWAARAEIALYEVSTAARIELDASTYAVQSPFPGRVVTSSLRVGQKVRQGEVLVALDSAAEELRLREQQARVTGIGAELERLHSELEAERAALAEERQSARLSAEEAASRARAAQADAHYAESELERAQELYQRGLIARRELEKAQFEAERLQATTVMLGSAAQRVPQEQATRERERDARIERLRARIAALRGEQEALAASTERLQYEIERRRIRAPADGVIAESRILQPGSVVDEGTHLATIVASGRFVIEAQFPPHAALGRIRPGQPGLLRLEGFPWTQFGTVAATVANVAQESRDGSVRVELEIRPDSTFRGKLEHGMPGSLELTVERVTPLALMLRTVGQIWTAPG